MSPTPSRPELLTLIDKLERAVFERRTADGVRLLLELLQALSLFRGTLGIMPPPGTAVQRRAAYTRIAAMVSALLCSPDFQMNLGQIASLCGRKPILEAIFELSGYAGPFHLLEFHGQRSEGGGVRLHANQIFVLALFYSLDDLPPSLLEGVLKLPAEQLLTAMAGWFTAPFVHSDLGESNRRVLIDASPLIEAASPTAEGLQAMTSAWMHISYADYKQKHAFKRSLNAVWRRLGAMAGLKSNPAPRWCGTSWKR